MAVGLFSLLSSLILSLVEVKTLGHPLSGNQQSLYTGQDYKRTNEGGRELQRQAAVDKDGGNYCNKHILTAMLPCNSSQLCSVLYETFDH